MEIRYAISEDKERIVELLRQSLGEESSPKSIAYWNWKHELNPFGASPVLLAEEAGELIGARAFMRWQWQWQKEKYSALRAVDTATHPAHQGKGIFKKLTLELVDASQKKGDHFVFNTPNEQSRPGYLKMGWVQADKISVGIRPFLRGLLTRSDTHSENILLDLPSLQLLCDQWNLQLQDSRKIFTPKSAAYLQWRYAINPVNDYLMYQDSMVFIAAHLRVRKGIKELRISELIGNLQDEGVRRRASKKIKAFAAETGALAISYSPIAHHAIGSVLGRVAAIGPLFTLRKLAIDEVGWAYLQDAGNWQMMIGDMEQF